MYRGIVVRKYEQAQQIEVVVDVKFLKCIHFFRFNCLKLQTKGYC